MGTHNATRVQQLIQDCLDSLKQFSVSWQQAGGSGTAPQQVAEEFGTSPALRAAEKNTRSGETSPLSKIKSSPDWSENVTDLVTTNTTEKAMQPSDTFELDSIELLHEEFLARKAQLEEHEKWIQLYKEKLDSLSNGATTFTLRGKVVATYRRNGNLNLKNLEAEHPDKVAQFTRLVTEMKFDREAFASQEPELFALYRAKVFRLPEARGIKTP